MTTNRPRAPAPLIATPLTQQLLSGALVWALGGIVIREATIVRPGLVDRLMWGVLGAFFGIMATLLGRRLRRRVHWIASLVISGALVGALAGMASRGDFETLRGGLIGALCGSVFGALHTFWLQRYSR